MREIKKMDKRKALKWLCIAIAAELFLVALFTWIFDPFYQYHQPFFGMEEVLYDRDNQVIGTIRNNDYDSVLLGSSVAENFDNTFLNEQFDCHTVKIIRASGSVADLLYYMDKAHEKQKLQRVFWCMDIFALTASTEVTLEGGDTPRYLHTETMLDDVTYLFNKDILFVKIPQMFAYGYLGENTGGNAYNWARGKEFSASKAMQAYVKPGEVVSAEEDPQAAERLAQNIALVEKEIENHPDTEYTILFPPYSMLWWDCGYSNGIAGQYFEVLEQTVPRLLSHENVEVYFFQSDREIVCNLDNYMDMIHYSPEINQYMLDALVQGTHKVTKDNWQEVLSGMRETYEYIISEGIYRYYPQNAE